MLPEIWDKAFINGFVPFQELPFARYWPTFAQWPKVEAYNHLLIEAQTTLTAWRFVTPSHSLNYEQAIFNNQQIPMRSECWHDFFNNLSWLQWPSTKIALNRRYYFEKAQFRPNENRTALQNLIAHIDEMAVILCYDEQSWQQKILDFDWLGFFLAPELAYHCYPLLLGHGLLEKARRPFIGLTAKVVFLKVAPSFFALSSAEKYHYADKTLAAYVLSDAFTPGQTLAPFPLLGWPGWYPLQDHAFYANKNYFRPKNASKC